MPRKASSQWAFGELFAPKELRPVLSVSQLTTQIRQLLEHQVGTIWVSGEVTNLRLQGSGHAYFALKDPSAQLSCVLFRTVAVAGRSLLDNGALVIARGELTVYEPRGQYQLVIRELEFQGAGALQAAFEKLKQKLEALGYFAQERKRRLPRFPKRIGLATSPSGAALRDVLHAIQRRQPSLEIVLAPCRVQGEGAASEIAAAVSNLNQWSQSQQTGRGLDLILVTRGGGSLEDLWAFNEPVVAEAIFQSALPVVSAVGHEIDFTICDFVADVRAATPSAGAELITEGTFASVVAIAHFVRRLRSVLRSGLAAQTGELTLLNGRLRRQRPSRWFRQQAQRLDELLWRAGRAAATMLRAGRHSAHATTARLATRPIREHIRSAGQQLNTLRKRMRTTELECRDACAAELTLLAAQLRLLSPEFTLERGYSITTDSVSGALIRDSKATQRGHRICTRVAGGRFESQVI